MVSKAAVLSANWALNDSQNINNCAESTFEEAGST